MEEKKIDVKFVIQELFKAAYVFNKPDTLKIAEHEFQEKYKRDKLEFISYKITFKNPEKKTQTNDDLIVFTAKLRRNGHDLTMKTEQPLLALVKMSIEAGDPVNVAIFIFETGVKTLLDQTESPKPQAN